MHSLKTLIIFILFCSYPSFSQVRQDIIASGNVLTPVSYSGAQNLSFGDIVPGITKTVSITDPVNAGLFIVNGEGSKEIQVTINRPANLIGPGGAVMPINFNTGDGIIATASQLSGPKLAHDGDITINLNEGKLYVLIGGSVVPSYNQIPGPYAAVVSFTTVYTGN